MITFSPLLPGLLCLALSICARTTQDPTQDPTTGPAATIVEDAIEAPALARVAVIGASASAGFGLAVDLPTAFAPLIRVEHEELLALGDGMFFTRPQAAAREQAEQALAHEPSLVIGLDFLFWMAYGNMPSNYRPKLLEEGLELLERFDCPVVISTLPDMSAAVGLMLSAKQVPSTEELATLNKRILAWATAHEAVVIDLASLVAQLEAGTPFDLAGTTWPPSEDVPLLLPDRLHPTGAGLAAMVTTIAQRLVESEVVPEAALQLDVAEAHRAITRLEEEAVERRREARKQRR